MLSPVLIDSSFLYELNNPRTALRQALVRFGRTEKRPLIIPDVALTECAYLIRQRIGQPALINWLQSAAALGFQFEPVLAADLQRAGDVMEQYRQADLDFVDCCIVALAERLNITTIYTLDRRDFSIFRPSHCDYLELLP